MPRLPQPGSDAGTWGEILNDYLAVAHASDGTLKAGSVTNSSIQPGAITSTKFSAGTPSAGQVLSYNGTSLTWQTPSSGVTDHGLLSGLTDDDHSQYHTDARGDARYYTQAQVDTSLSGKANTSHTHTASQVSDSTATGRAVLIAADAGAARAAIGAGTSSFDGVYGSLTGTPTLGTAAATDAADYATAAQGALADNAIQPGADASVLGSGAAASGTVLTADGSGSTAWAAASDGQTPNYWRRGMPSPNWVRVQWANASGDWSGSGRLNQLALAPIFCDDTRTIDRVRFQIVTAGSVDSIARIGLWAADPTTWRPTGNPLSVVDVACDTTGHKELVLSPGVTVSGSVPYFIGFVFQATTAPAMRRCVGTEQNSGWYLTDGNAAAEMAYTGNSKVPHWWTVSDVSGVLGDLTGASFVASDSVPLVAYRFVI